MSFIKYIADENHYKEVLSLVSKAKQTVWIGTADIKDLYVDDKPFLALIASLLKKGVEVRLIHAKEPGTAWREDHEKHPILYDGMERVLCPRVHFKLIIIDTTIAYVGSANLTGAGMGMKSPRKRNFEAGILTDDPEMVDAAIEQFDNVWIGKFCKECGRREYCSDPIKKHHMQIIRATKTAEQAGAYYVRIQAMARKHQITLYAEFDEHDTPETKYIVVVDDYLPVATCRLYAIDNERVMLGRIVVLPEYRHQGLGTLVVQEAEKWAEELGYRTSVLESRDNKIHFYETMGYVADYSQKIVGETFTCYKMEKQLK